MLLVQAVYTKSLGQPATGESLSDIAMYLYRRAKATGAVSTVWNGVNPTEECGAGAYTRAYADADMITYDYFAYAVYSGATVLDSNYSTMAAGGVDAESLWSYSDRTLTMTAAEITAAVDGDTITIQRGDTVTIAITGLGDISARTKLWFTVKRHKSELDTAAIIQVTEAGGLIYLNGAAAVTPTQASITINDAVAGDVTITLAAAATAALAPRTGLYYDIQMLATTVTTLTAGSLNITADVTRATS